MDRVVKAGIAADTSLELVKAVDLAQQLDLEPALADLNVLDRRQRWAQLGNADQGDRADQVDETLREANDRPNLADGLQLSAIDRLDPGELLVECDGDGRPEDVADPSNTSGVCLTHQARRSALRRWQGRQLEPRNRRA